MGKNLRWIKRKLELASLKRNIKKLEIQLIECWDQAETKKEKNMEVINTKLEERQIEVIQKATSYFEKKLGNTKGQAFYNALFALHPELAKSIRYSEYDTFDNDENIENCINFITVKYGK